MEFNELKVIWDSRNQEPLYAMNEAALQAIIQRKNQESDRCLSRCFATEITIGLVCGALMFICAGALLLCLIQKRDNFFQQPNVIRNARSHRRRDAYIHV